MSEYGDWENPSEELKRANHLAMDMGKRIAELEAELAEFKAERKARHYVHAEFSCAEADRRRKKAEAEVERWRRFHELYCHPECEGAEECAP